MVCPHCHRNIPSEAVFCGACGRRVVGWKGTPTRRHDAGEDPRVGTGPAEDTRRVRPNSELIRAAGGDPNATRKMSPNSDLLRVVRGEPEQTDRVRPSSSLIRASVPPERAAPERAPAQPPPRRAAQPDPDELLVDTAFLMEHALHRGRSRLWVLMIADGCLLAVGIYLIVSWALLPRGLTSADLAPTSSPGTRGYVDWRDDGLQPARIATGPVRATFDVDGADAGAAVAPRVGPRPMADAGPTRPRIRPMTDPAMAAMRPPPMDPVMADPTAVAQARRLAKLLAARKVFLKAVPRRIRSRRKAIHDCYRQTLRLFKNVKGFVDIEFVVGADGRVTNARASRNTTRSRTLGSCISGVFLATVFPSPPGGAVTLRYPFHFTPRKK